MIRAVGKAEIKSCESMEQRGGPVHAGGSGRGQRMGTRCIERLSEGRHPSWPRAPRLPGVVLGRTPAYPARHPPTEAGLPAGASFQMSKRGPHEVKPKVTGGFQKRAGNPALSEARALALRATHPFQRTFRMCYPTDLPVPGFLYVSPAGWHR